MAFCRPQEGLANVCLVGGSVTVVKAKIEANLPRKRGAALAGYDKAITSFHEKVGSRSQGFGDARSHRAPAPPQRSGPRIAFLRK